MSHFSSVELQIKDREALEAALKTIGFEIESHKTAQALNTHWSSMTSGAAQIIVRCSNPKNQIGRADIGFLQDGDVWKLVADDYELRQSRVWTEQSLTSKIKVEYGVAVATKAAIAKGMMVDRLTTSDGKVQLKLTQQTLVSRR